MSTRRDRLTPTQPHTPRQPFKPDDMRATCSRKASNNVGCDQYDFCPVVAIREEMAGPVEVAVEDHRDVPRGEGRRFASWCHLVAHQYTGQHAKPGFSICEDRIFYTKDGTKDVARQFPPYEEQGPHYWPMSSAAPSTGLHAQRDALLRGEDVDTARHTKRQPVANDSHG